MVWTKKTSCGRSGCIPVSASRRSVARDDDHSGTLSRLGPDTPFESYTAEFGEPMHHFTDVELMKSWGPRTDDVLLTKTELYYFGYWGLPHRYVAVYIDRDTRHSVVVTWKYM